MKKFKKLIGMFLALAMVVTLAVPTTKVEAAETTVTDFDVVVTGNIYEGEGPFYYESLIDVVLTMSDGTTETYDDFEYLAEVYEPASVYIESDMPEGGWSVGDSYKATATWMGFTAEYEIPVVENPIISIEAVVGHKLYEGTQDVYERYNSAGEFVEYKAYNIYQAFDGFKITTADGTETLENWEIFEKYGTGVSVIDTQSPDNTWDELGEYILECELFGKTCQATVEIVENPVKSISASAMTVYEGEQIYVDELIRDFEVTYTDGTVETYPSIWYDSEKWDGQYASVRCEVDEFEGWELGTYSATVEFFGKTTDVEIEVIESPIKSIDVITRDAYVWEKGYDIVDGVVEREWFDPSVCVTGVKVTYTDGTEETTTFADLFDKYQRWTSWRSEVFDEDFEIKVGTYTATVNFMGAADTYDVVIKDKAEEVTIVNSPETVTTINSASESITTSIENGTVSSTAMDKETLGKAEEVLANDGYVYMDIELKELTEAEVVKVLPATQKAAIEAAVAETLGAEAQIQYLDIDAILYGDGEELGNVYETGKEITIKIAVPEELKGKDVVYKVIRTHNGEVDVLDAAEDEDGYITFKTDRFSTYALVYADADKVPTTDGGNSNAGTGSDATSPETGDTTPYGLYAIICAAGVAAVLAVRMRKLFVK